MSKKDLKLEEKELNNLNNLVNTIKEGHSRIGALELDKSKLIDYVKQVESSLNEVQKAMAEKYGEGLSIDLETGILSEAE